MKGNRDRKNVKNLTIGAIIAAMYVVLTLLSQIISFSSGPVQFRFSEVITILPVFTFAAVPGLSIGCFLANLITGCTLYDVIFGSFATLVGAIGTYYIGRKNPYLSVISPIIANTIVIPFILKYAYGAEGTLPYFMLTIFISESLSAGLAGIYAYKALKKVAHEIL